MLMLLQVSLVSQTSTADDSLRSCVHGSRMGKGCLGRQVPQARQMLRKLVVG